MAPFSGSRIYRPQAGGDAGGPVYSWGERAGGRAPGIFPGLPLRPAVVLWRNDDGARAAGRPGMNGRGADVTHWDAWQLEALKAVESAEGAVSIVGGPGTGKTAVLEELVRRAAGGGKRVALLAADRRAAGDSLVRVSLSLGALSGRVEVRSIAAFCYAIVEEFAEQTGRERPELVSGPEEDMLLKEILDRGEIAFPARFPSEVQAMPAFRAEMRNLLTRASELGLGPDELAALGRRTDNGLWTAGAAVRKAYLRRLEEASHAEGTAPGLLAARRLDHSMLVSEARRLLEGWEEAASVSVRSAKPVRKPAWDLVLVDDIQNAPRSILGLLSRLSKDGAIVVAAGDPDSSVQGFRGAVASLPADLARGEPEGLGARLVPLGRSHRGGAMLAAVGERVSSRIRVAGSAAGRAGEHCDVKDEVGARRYANEAEEAAGIARAIREWHLFDGVPYGEIAVVTRSRSAHGPIRREMVRRSVPVAAIGSDLPLHMQPAVRALLDVIGLAIGPPTGSEEAGRKVRDVLEGPLFDVDGLALRRLGRRLRALELAAGGSRPETGLFAVALDGPEAVTELSETGLEEILRCSRVLDEIREAARGSAQAAEQVLWAAWDSCDVADRWRASAMESGSGAEEAGDNLDAVLQLFRFAQRMADRDSATGIAAMVAELEAQELPQDSIARRGADGDAVVLATPAALQGREFSRVVIARMNEGTWPNLTLRDPLVRTSELSARVSGRYVDGLSPADAYRAELQEVLDDELRQLRHAVGRARDVLLVTCVEGEDSTPSRFLRAMGFVFAEEADGEAEDGGEARPVAVVAKLQPSMPDLDAVGLVGSLRRYALVEGPVGERARALLSRFEDSGVRRPLPGMWMDEATPTSGGGERRGRPRVSPSGVEGLLACPLRAVLSKLGFADADRADAARAGTTIHRILERHPVIPEGTSQTEFAEMLKGEFLETWQAEAGNDVGGWAARDLERYLAALDKAAMFIAGTEGEVLTEHGFAVERGNAVVAGTIDRIVVNGSSSIVYDYKTGKTAIPVKEAEDNVQLQLYQWALRHDTRIPPASKAVLVYLATGTKKPAERVQSGLDDAGLARAEERIDASARLLVRERVPARANTWCDTCSLRILCPEHPEGRIFS